MLLLVDLDGVVYRGAEPVPGVAAVLADRARRGDDVVYVTNNSMWYRADYVTRLAGMGAPVSADRVVSSSRATALYLREHLPDVRRVADGRCARARARARGRRHRGRHRRGGRRACRAGRASTGTRRPAGRTPSSSGSTPASTTSASPPRPTASGRRPVHRHEPRRHLSHRAPAAARRRRHRRGDRVGGRPRAGGLDRQARAAAPARGGQRGRREGGGRRDDRRRDRHRPRGRPGRRRALHPHAHRA